MTKTAEKPYPLGLHIYLYSPYKGDSPPPREYHPCTVAPPRFPFVCYVRPATLAFVSFFVFAILPDPLREKLSYEKITSPPGAYCETQGFFWDSRANFTTKVAVVNFPSAGWLNYLRTQLKGFVGGVCRDFLSAVSRIIFFPLEADTLKS